MTSLFAQPSLDHPFVVEFPRGFDAKTAMLQTSVTGSFGGVGGLPQCATGTLAANECVIGTVVDGKSARTRYHVLSEYRTPAEASGLECRLESGRTHQIRVHLAAIGHPVVGDGTYGGIRHGIVAPRPFLHAAELAFVHPISGESLMFVSALPDDLAAVEAQLTT
jgi:23S rRNA pseudouridine1911/1915/1917 synthase